MCTHARASTAPGASREGSRLRGSTSSRSPGPKHHMGMDAANVRLHQRVREQGSVGIGHAAPGEDDCDLPLQKIRSTHRSRSVPGFSHQPSSNRHISPMFVARAPRCRCRGPHGPKVAEGVVDTTSKRLEGVRPAMASRLASAAGHRENMAVKWLRSRAGPPSPGTPSGSSGAVWPRRRWLPEGRGPGRC